MSAIFARFRSLWPGRHREIRIRDSRDDLAPLPPAAARNWAGDAEDVDAAIDRIEAELKRLRAEIERRVAEVNRDLAP